MAATCHLSIVQPWKCDMLCRAEVHARLGVCKITSGVKLCRSVAPSPQGLTRRTAMLHSISDVRQRSQLLTRAATQSTGEASTALQPDMTKTKVLFVCKGNICRSPAAGSMLKKVVERSGVAGEFEIDSCGTGGSGHEEWYKLDSKDHWEEHADKTVDDRMADALKKRNLDPFSDSRPLEPEDFQKFDYIIGMNEQNFQEVEKAALYWKDTLNKPIPGNWRDKVQPMTKYLISPEYQGASEVPDPFHGGQEGFEKVLDLLEDACQGLLSHIHSNKFATES